MVLKTLGGNAGDVMVRAWVKAPDYWGVFFKMIEL